MNTLLCIDQHILEETQTMDWIQKDEWYGPANLYYGVSENVQNILSDIFQGDPFYHCYSL